MRILLLGEFSSLHKNLKEGLLALGHDAVVAASSDGFKKIVADINFEPRLTGVLGNLERAFRPLKELKHLKGYDVVQLINPFVFYYEKIPYSIFPKNYFLNQIIYGNKKFFVLAAGDDAFFWRHGRKGLKYGPFNDFLKYDLKSKNYYMETEKAFNFNKNLLEKSNGIIPIMYEYEKSYEGHPKRLNTIPIPMNVDKITYIENIAKKRLVVFHGLNRYGFKGTRHVEEAFNYLKNKYPNDLELVIDGKLPLNDYLALMRRANVVIDQLYSHSLGINGVYALAMGKIVMGGAEPESLKSLGIDSTPAINLEPNAQSIIENIENLIERKKDIANIGYESRKFAEKVHSHIKVAQQYLDVWSAN